MPYLILLDGKLYENLTEREVKELKRQLFYKKFYELEKRVKQLEDDSKEKKKS
jgi:hypothetical protein